MTLRTAPQPQGCTNRLHLTGIKCDTEQLPHTPDHIITLRGVNTAAGLPSSVHGSQQLQATPGRAPDRKPNGEIQKLSHRRTAGGRYAQGADRTAGARHLPVLLRLVFLHPVERRRRRGVRADHQRRVFTHGDAVPAEDRRLRLDSKTGIPQQPAQHGRITPAVHRRDPRAGSLRPPHVHLLGGCHRPTPRLVLLLPARLASPSQQRPHQTVSQHLPAGPLAPGVHGRDDAAQNVGL